MLLREGERVAEFNLLKLEALQAQTKKEQILLSSLGAAMLLMCLSITTYILHLNYQGQMATYHVKNLLLIASLALTFFFLAEVSASFSESLTRNSPVSIPGTSIYFGMPLAAGAMLSVLPSYFKTTSKFLYTFL